MTALIKQISMCVLTVWLTASPARTAERETLFNGKDLTGWKGLEGFWSVQDGAIVGETTAEKKIQKNTFLVWQGGNVTDFEFTATVRFNGNNSGVQYRSQFIDEPMLALKGYQLDLHPTPKLFGMLYGEKYDGRSMIATRGQRVEVGSDGTVKQLGKVGKDDEFTDWTWNNIRIISVGSRLIHQVNGVTTIDDTNGDDLLDHAELLSAYFGKGEHGNHGLVDSEDGEHIFAVSGNHTPLPAARNVVRRRNPSAAEDLLLPRLQDPKGHAAGILAAGGWITRFDLVKRTHDLYCAGFRNQYDVTLNAQGDLFTYDADMEWDLGLPWYRPTRICHAVSGGDYGWRNGSGKWKEYYEDSLPPLTPDGASYKAEAENFVSGPALPVTDAVVGTDGALYFTTGGRGTQSELMRVVYATGHFGKWHLGPEPYSPLQQGLDVDLPHTAGPGPSGSFVAPWKFKDFDHDPQIPDEHIEDAPGDSRLFRLLRFQLDKPTVKERPDLRNL